MNRFSGRMRPVSHIIGLYFGIAAIGKDVAQVLWLQYLKWPLEKKKKYATLPYCRSDIQFLQYIPLAATATCKRSLLHTHKQQHPDLCDVTKGDQDWFGKSACARHICLRFISAAEMRRWSGARLLSHRLPPNKA